MIHLMKLDVFKPILDLTIQESRRDSLLSASCLEFFEHMRRVRHFLVLLSFN
jgi:protein phosphatase-4 regulatory subunit 3